MKIRKSLAGIAAGSLALAGIAVVSAPAANAATQNNVPLNGSPANQAGTSSYGSTPNLTLTATQVGDDVQIDLNISQGPTTTSFAGFNANEYRLDGYVRIDGGPQIQLTGQVGTVAVPPSSVSYPAGTTASALVSGLSSGAHSIVLQSVVAEGSGSGSGGAFATTFSQVAGFDAIYNLGATTAAIVANPPTSPIGLTQGITVTVANFAVSSVTGQTVNTVARSGNTINISGDTWTASTAVTAVTVGGIAAANTLTVNGSGQISGGITVPAGVGNGNQNIVVTQGAKTATVAIQILGTPTVVTPASGVAGGNPTVTGSDFNPGDTITVAQLDSANAVIAGTSVTTTAGATGTISKQITLNAGATKIQVSDTVTGFSQANAISISATQCTAQTGSGGTGSCDTKQQATATINPGSLTQALTNRQCTIGSPITGSYKPSPVAPAVPFTGLTCVVQNPTNAVVDFGATTVAATATKLGAVMNTARVVDARGIVDNWSLTASLDAPLTSGTNTMAKSAVAIAPTACSDNTVAETFPGSGVFVGKSAATTLGTGAPLSSAVTLCSNSASQINAAGSTGGDYNVDASLQLTVPAFQAVGTYTANLVLTLA